MISTQMSRSVTAGIADFNHANVALEDVILIELSDCKAPENFRRSLYFLSSAIGNFDDAIKFLRDLGAEMDATSYQPLPSFANYSTADKARALASELADHGLMSFEKTEKVIIPQIGNGKGFYAAIPVLHAELIAMRDSVQTLYDRMFAASSAAEIGTVAELLETNASLNFRADFLRAFNTINNSFAIFAASAAWSTEMWYRSTSVGTLLSDGSDDLMMVG